ncbi:MAG: hypothetical protein EAX89_06725 [Candidatus Lokiarchaeota archaeon]|nr:hypothetical protein [Candidatus Lokiarchaeota archaeon]
MNCERTLEVLSSIKNKEDIVTSYEEISELMQYHLISQFESKEINIDHDREITSTKMQFIQLTQDIREAYKTLVTLEGEYHHVSTVSRSFSFLKVGKGARLKKEIKDLKKFIQNKEIDSRTLKDKILELTRDLESIERAVKVNGLHVTLTPLGELMIDEIHARRRFYSRDLRDLIEVLNALDNAFNSIIYQIGNIMSTHNFSPIWALYLINMNMLSLTEVMNSITMSEYNYNIAQKRMMKLSFYLINNPGAVIPRNNRDAKMIENNLRTQYPYNQPKEIIDDILRKITIPTREREKIMKEISLLGKLFTIWSSQNQENYDEITQYYENLKIFVDFQRDLPMIGKRTHLYQHLTQNINEEMVFVLLILAFSTNLDAYNYFYELIEDIPEGTKFFSSIASLYPWESEETWMILLRAQSNILKAQSAKFIPELMEYALLMCLNPNVLKIENNLSEKQLSRWRNLIIPTIHLSIYSFFEQDLETYIRTRPLAYIIAPRYYHRSMLHYHAIG